MTPKKFTRADPCTKVDLHNAFWYGDGYAGRPVVEAKSIIGENAPKYMLREGYLTQDIAGGVDMYRLTDAGADWIAEGFRKHLERHPEDRAKISTRTPGGAHAKPAVKRRTRPA